MLANCFRSASDLRESIPKSVSKLAYGLGVSDEGSERGGFLVASVKKVEATENWPSLKRCMAMARLISAGCEDRAS